MIWPSDSDSENEKSCFTGDRNGKLMRKTKFMILVVLSVFALVVVGCGGGGGDSSSPAPTSQPPQLNSGGTPDAPSLISFALNNQISSNTFQNYYHYDAQQGETIYLHATLNNPLSDTERARCSGSPYYGISVNGSGVNCGVDLAYTFPADGTYTFNLRYPNDNSGFFEAAVVAENFTPGSVSDIANGEGGTPDAPSLISFALNNQISSNTFHNYYYYDAQQGETIYLHATLNNPLSDTVKARCSGSPYYGISVNGSSKNCGVDLTYTFPADGTYTFTLGYPYDNSGFFEAAITP
jgi:hypothetical protein